MLTRLLLPAGMVEFPTEIKLAFNHRLNVLSFCAESDRFNPALLSVALAET